MESRDRKHKHTPSVTLSVPKGVASMLNPPPHRPSPHKHLTHGGRKEPHSVLYSTQYKATPPSHSSTDPVTLRPSDPPPPPSCRKPGWGEESLSLVFSFNYPLLTLTSLKSFFAFPSSTHRFTHNVPPLHSLNRFSVLLVHVSLKSVFLLLLQVQQVL